VDEVIRFAHLVSAAVWVGGLIVLGSIAAGLRRSGAGPEQMQAMARSFGRVAWPAIVGAVAMGFWQADRLDTPFRDGAMVAKMVLVLAAVALTAIHQTTARRSTPAVRGAIQGSILLLSLGIVGAAVAL
jgi:putative copper export protein